MIEEKDKRYFATALCIELTLSYDLIPRIIREPTFEMMEGIALGYHHWDEQFRKEYNRERERDA